MASAPRSRVAGDTVGPYAITTTLVDPNGRLGNYAVTNAGATFTINARPVTVVTQPASKTYGDADPNPLTTADLSVFLAADAITATFARAAGDTVGPYAITTTLVDPERPAGQLRRHQRRRHVHHQPRGSSRSRPPVLSRLYDGTAAATVNLAHDALVGRPRHGWPTRRQPRSPTSTPAAPSRSTSPAYPSTGGADGANYTLNGGDHRQAASADHHASGRSPITAVTDSRVYNGAASSDGRAHGRHPLRAQTRVTGPRAQDLRHARTSAPARRCRSRPTSSTTGTASATTTR